MRQWGFYFDQSRCVGCYACSVACKDWHDIAAGPIQWRRVISRERGTYPDVFLSYLSLSCNHCALPACAGACPAKAISKRTEDGIVVVNRDALPRQHSLSITLQKGLSVWRSAIRGGSGSQDADVHLLS